LALFLVGWPAVGEAEDKRPLAEAVRVEPGASCVTAASLSPQIEAWLGSDRVEAGLTVSVRGSPVDPRDVAFEVRRDGQPIGQRRFLPAPWVCAQLESTLALAIAMALKVSLRDELLDTLGGAADARAESSLGLLLRGGFDVLPGLSLGAGVTGARAFGGRFMVRAEAAVDLARDASFAAAPGRFDSMLLAAQLAGCAWLPLRPGWRARTCLGFALGALQARGRGYAESRTDWLAWLAAESSLALSVRLNEHWWLDMPGSIVVPLNKVTFGVERQGGDVAATRSLPRLGFRLAVGPQYHF
jgi:hypothetical protein